jgi:hypothetical protein
VWRALPVLLSLQPMVQSVIASLPGPQR